MMRPGLIVSSLRIAKESGMSGFSSLPKASLR